MQAAATVVFSPQVWPKAWNMGRQPMITSSGLFQQASGRHRGVARRLAWVSCAPFGVPVVPEV